ncbi:MAG: 4-hydroxy-3-methylbut-2-enyl diphosphate reductase [Bacteroidales bacterium]|nr:4-hydroxy-3-methylbut-2-enyl diphosphate reductase [Bacteroidales bacterium]
MAIIEIDTHSGFCLGVVNAIKKAEDFLDGHDSLYSLGDIVHNNKEVERLESKGMKTITRKQMLEMHHTDILFRAHGEPPITYEKAKELGMRLIDATCPVVLSLQAKVRVKYKKLKDTDTQLVLFGKKGHAEVIGLLGQTENKAIVLEKLSDASLLDFSKPIVLFSQTTKSLEEFQALVSLLRASMNPGVSFEYHDTICRQVANRMPLIRNFSKKHDCILFVSGAKSSNGKALFEACHSENTRTFFITGPNDVLPSMFSESDRIGICGATSTPVWLMEDVKKQVEKLLSV